LREVRSGLYKPQGHIDLTLISCKTCKTHSAYKLCGFGSSAKAKDREYGMELLLNILWLTLAVPAVWLWHRDPAGSAGARSQTNLRPLLLLACALALLFPVVSATDDIHVMRSEMEEPGPSKRELRTGTGDKVPSWLSGCSAPATQPCEMPSLWSQDTPCGRVLDLQKVSPEPAPRWTSGCRAPPTSEIS